MNETQQIEGYIFQTLPPDERLVFEAKLITDPFLAAKVEAQLITYRAIEDYSRSQVREELKAIEGKLFTHPKHASFRQTISKIFHP